MVDEDPVVLFGHCPVEAAQARLDVHDREPGGVRRQGAGQRGVGVALHDHRIRGQLREQVRELRRAAPDLLGAGQAAELQPVRGRREPEAVEEDLGQAVVVVLAGVDHDRGIAQAVDNAGELDDLRSGAQNHRNPEPGHDRAARRRASERSRPSSSIDSNSGGETPRPVTATRMGP